jgi:hypothetical protein
MKNLFKICVLLLTLTSCSKWDIHKQSQCKILTLNSTKYSYDTQGRLISINAQNGYSATYKYSASSVVIQYSSSRDEYLLNSKGLAISETDYDANNKVTYKATFEYDSNDFLIKRVYQGYDPATGKVTFESEVNYVIKDGNTVSVTYKSGLKYTYSFYQDKIRLHTFGDDFTGKSDKNLIKSVDSDSYTDDYTYEFIGDMISSRLISELNKTTKLKSTYKYNNYSYQCE